MTGSETTQSFDAKPILASLSHRPGVYRMFDARGRLIYVGKAKSLKRRVSSYFQGRALDAKTMALVQQIAGLEVTVTRTESEALMLEYNLIKEHRPRFNVVLRDDKSYPYISVSTDHDFPRLSFYRGVRKKGLKLFGPYPSAGSVRETLKQLQKLFLYGNARIPTFQPKEALLAISNPTLHGTLCRCDQQGGVRTGRRACLAVLVR